MFILASFLFIYTYARIYGEVTKKPCNIMKTSWFIILRLEPLVFIIPSPPTAPVSASTWSGPRNRFGLTYASP